MLEKNVPIMGICMGNQILALASGAKRTNSNTVIVDKINHVLKSN